MPVQYEIHADKAKLMLSFGILCAAMAYMGYGLFMKPPGDVPMKYSFVFKNTHQLFIFCLVLCTPVFWYASKLLLSSKPVIVINSEGILDRRHVKSVIPWSGITGTGFDSMKISMSSLNVWAIQLTDYQMQKTRFTLSYHVNKWFYSRKNPNLVIFHLNGLDYDFGEFQAALNAQLMRRQPQQHYGQPSRGARMFG